MPPKRLQKHQDAEGKPWAQLKLACIVSNSMSSVAFVVPNLSTAARQVYGPYITRALNTVEGLFLLLLSKMQISPLPYHLFVQTG